MLLRRIRLYVQRVIEFFGRFSRKNAVVLMFHHVYDNERQFDPYSISKENYIDLISCLRKKKCDFIDLKEMKKSRNSAVNVLITFDDAFDDVYKNAFSFMKSNNLPFTVFQTVEYIGRDGFLSDAMIREMQLYTGFTLGAHSVSHRSTYELTKQESDYEAYESKKKLQEQFGQEIFAYAYPYGSLNHVKKANIYSAKKAQYSMAFATIKKGVRLSKIKGNFFIPRINVNDNNFKEIIARYIG